MWQSTHQNNLEIFLHASASTVSMISKGCFKISLLTFSMNPQPFFFQLNGQCSVMNCPIKFNCCQQSGICPKNKICVPLNFPEQPWKRFACKCPDGYHGDSCAQPIRSCESYANGSRISGMYNVTAYNGTVYEVYCHFDSDASWTLVQSYSFANASSYESKFRKPLYESHPVSKNSLTWSGYRLSKPRMKSIQHNSAFLQFTCEYEKTRDVTKSDYVQIPFEDIKEHSTVVDILEYNVTTGYLTVREGRGQIGNNDVSHCKIWLHQSSLYSLGIGFTRNYQTTSCKTSDLSQLSCPSTSTYYLFRSNSRPCIREVHRCLQHRNSTTQLWFGSPTFTAM